jgi:hypothetical protein
MPGEEDAKLLDLAGAVAQALAGAKLVAPTAANGKGSDTRTPALPIAKNEPIKITGGTVSEYNDAKGVQWTVLVFTNNGTWEVAKDGFVDVLVVGGGGGGNSGDDGPGGGGNQPRLADLYGTARQWRHLCGEDRQRRQPDRLDETGR